MPTHAITTRGPRTLSRATLGATACCALLFAACGPQQFQVRYEALPVQVIAEKLPEKIEISERIQFRTGRADLLEASHPVLDEVAQAIMGNGRITLVEVQGHTDSRGDYDDNLELSQERAEEVRRYLVGRGVEASRLRAKGYGPDSPIADNYTPEGRRDNRRVEFVLANPGAKAASPTD